MAGLKNNRSLVGLSLALAVVTLVVYLPATRNGFVNIDDQEYIVENPHVTAGLTWQGMAWAMQSGYASNWHPLTWMTHMLDCQLYGLNAGGHHLTNVLLHVADSVLLLLLLYQMTGSRWRSAMVAALFAWHPLHVESVAWASERKDVLSTLFWLLTMMAYVNYARERAQGNSRWKIHYGLALVCFVLGLMSKPMLVTLPCVLLLIDFWPLNRISNLKREDRRKTLARLLLEKAPFFLLALGASIVTYQVQQASGAMSSFEELSLPVRAGTAIRAYLQYISKTLWPADDLAVFYPYSKHQSAALVIVCGGLLVLLSVLFLLAGRRRPYLVTGWFWYLGTLVPTIGLVQVGAQSMADRYMYIPSIGFFVLVVWGLDDFLAAVPRKRELLAAAGTAALAGCLFLTWVQVQYWHDDLKIFGHAIEATEGNYVAINAYGGALEDTSQSAQSKLYYEKAVEINPRYPEAQYNLGTALLKERRLEDAIVHFKAALAVNPKYVPAMMNLGKAFMNLGQLDDATGQLVRAEELMPKYERTHYNLGTLYLIRGKLDEAIAQFSEAVRLKPDYPEALGNLGISLMNRGRAAEGIARLSEAVRLKPQEPGTHANLGVALLAQGRLDEAATQFDAVLRLKPDDAEAHYNLGRTLALRHQAKEAAGHYREALRLKPEFTEVLNGLAWILSTDPDPEVRDGKQAVQLAQKACELTRDKQANPLLTLAAAYAETGQFGEATAKAQQARELATASGQREVAERSANALKLFQAGQPFRETK